MQAENRHVKVTSDIQVKTSTKLKTIGAAHPFTFQVDVLFPSSDILETALRKLTTRYVKAQVKLADVVDSNGPFANVYSRPQGHVFSKLPLFQLALTWGYTFPSSRCFSMLATDPSDDVWCIDPRGLLTLLVTKTTYERLGLVGTALPFKAHKNYFVIRLPLQKNAESVANQARRNQALKAWDEKREQEGLGAWNVVYCFNASSATSPTSTTTTTIIRFMASSNDPLDAPNSALPVSLMTPEAVSTESNPWNDVILDPDNTKRHSIGNDQPLHTPDPSEMDQSIVHGLESVIPPSTVDPPPKVSQDLLNQFDPLVSLEEEAARDAWESSESHPPPPRTPSPKPPPPPLKENLPSSPPESPQSAGSHVTSPFPSFAAFARSFAIPSISRPRPLSMDQAKPVPSPSTLSSFAAQQDSPRDNVASTSRDATAEPTDGTHSGTASPAPGFQVQGEILFDFQSFLDQMKSRNAEPVSKYLRSFLSNFAKRTFTVHDQVKIINDFLGFIAGQMRVCDPWKNVSDAEFDNAMEGMEKLVMNRLYDFTFTPQLLQANPPRPITTDDLERDRVLSQRIGLFGWIEERHLDIPEGEGSTGFLLFAQQELLKINHYKAPRDKLICILNCCKVIYGMSNDTMSSLAAINESLYEDGSRLFHRNDGPFIPFQYLARGIRAGTCLTNVAPRNVEEAIQMLPQSGTASPLITQTTPARGPVPPPKNSHVGEESAQPLAISTPVQSISDDAKRLLQKTGDTISKPLNAISRIFSEALDGAEGKLSYLPGPFAPLELGREQREQGSTTSSIPRLSYPEGESQGGLAQVPHTPHSKAPGVRVPPIHTPYKPRVRRIPSSSSSTGSASPRIAPDETPSRLGPPTHQPLAIGPSYNLLSPVSPRVQSLGGDGQSVSRTPTPNLDLAGMSRQIDVAHEQAAVAAKETLMQIFPGVETEVIELVLDAQDGDLGKSIEALLEISAGS
ncbi:hypothetical protein H0H93_010384 [Arthromyces matolae]|nr:hypothetical protein H0H93_010384 [Arthromyces matolae]